MKFGRRSLWILLGCTIAAVLLLTVSREREPRYQNKSLSQWAHIVNRGPNDESRQQAEDAIRQIGTNGLPFLLRWIQYEERPWRKHFADYCARLPGRLGETAESFVIGLGPQRQGDAFSAFHALGPLARPAIPILSKQVCGPTLTPVSHIAALVLANIGDDALPSMLNTITNAAENPLLRNLLIEDIDYSWSQYAQTNLLESALSQCANDQNSEVAVCAAGVICNHDLTNEQAMRVLTMGVGNPMKRTQHIAVRYVRSYLGKLPKAAIFQYLQDTNSLFSPYAAESLIGITQKDTKEPFTAESVLPVLTNSLHDSRPLVRSYSATAIGSFDESAEPAVPAILDAFSDPDTSVRTAATNALFRLPAYRVFHDIATLEQLNIPASGNQLHYRGYFNYPPGPPLSRLLEHRDPRIREMATNAFRKLSENSSQNSGSDDAAR